MCCFVICYSYWVWIYSRRTLTHHQCSFWVRPPGVLWGSSFHFMELTLLCFAATPVIPCSQQTTPWLLFLLIWPTLDHYCVESVTGQRFNCNLNFIQWNSSRDRLKIPPRIQIVNACIFLFLLVFNCYLNTYIVISIWIWCKHVC